MTQKIRWSHLNLRDANGTDAHNIIGPNGLEDRYFVGLREFRRIGSIDGLYFERIGQPHEDPDDPSTWGPQSPDDVDWTGFSQ